MATKVIRTGTATVDGKTRPVRQLGDGTVQWSNRSDPRKGKWTSLEADWNGADLEWTWTDEDAHVAAVANVLDQLARPEDSEDEVALDDAHDRTHDEPAPEVASVVDQLFGDAPRDADGARFYVVLFGAGDRPLFFARRGERLRVTYLRTDEDVDAFARRNLVSAWTYRAHDDEETRSDSEEWLRRAVLRIEVRDVATDAVVRTLEPQKTKAAAQETATAAV